MLLIPEESSSGRRRRRRYTDEYKARLVAQCQQPHVSVAAIALSHGINANLLRKWIREQGDAGRIVSPASHALVPAKSGFIELHPSLPGDEGCQPGTAAPTRITVELSSNQGPVRLHWPAEHADRLAVCLKVLLT